MSKYKNVKTLSFNEVRGDEKLTIKLPKGGWHFSFMGGEEMVRKKMLSYSAKDLASVSVLNSITENIKNDIDPFFRGKLIRVEIDGTYPSYLLENIDKYENFIKK